MCVPGDWLCLRGGFEFPEVDRAVSSDANEGLWFRLGRPQGHGFVNGSHWVDCCVSIRAKVPGLLPQACGGCCSYFCCLFLFLLPIDYGQHLHQMVTHFAADFIFVQRNACCAHHLLFGGNDDGQPSATMMMGYLYMVGSEEKMGITPDFAKAEQVRGTREGRGGEALVTDGGTECRIENAPIFPPAHHPPLSRINNPPIPSFPTSVVANHPTPKKKSDHRIPAPVEPTSANNNHNNLLKTKNNS